MAGDNIIGRCVPVIVGIRHRVAQGRAEFRVGERGNLRKKDYVQQGIP